MPTLPDTIESRTVTGMTRPSHQRRYNAQALDL
jgi:hypothetical protein